MSMNNKKKPVQKKALGRGLAALLGGQEEAPIRAPKNNGRENEQVKQTLSPSSYIVKPKLVDGEEFKLLNISHIQANPGQPRKIFNEESIKELALSIKEQGLIQPITVKKEAENKYIIIAGERRFRAMKLLGLKQVKSIIRNKTKTKIQNDLASIIENLQRDELNPVELAEAYDQLLKTKQFTQESLAKQVGISRVKLANTVRLNNLPKMVKEQLSVGRIKEGQARALLPLVDKPKQLEEIYNKIIQLNLNTRNIEREVAIKLGRIKPNENNAINQVSVQTNQDNESTVVKRKSQEFVAIEEEMRRRFGTKVNISGNLNKGVFEIFFSGDDSFRRIIHKLRGVDS